MNDTNSTSLPPTPPTPPAPANASNTQTSIVIGGVLILLGVIFLAFNVIHIDFGQIWPIIFFIIGAGFYLPVLLMPRDRQNLAGLLVPGTILFGLGTIFFYNTFTNNWGSWAYIWTLIPASVGLGLLIAARVGHWGDDTMKVGFWMFVISTGVCLILASFFSGGNVGAIGAILLIGLGVVLLIQSIRR
jgi:hypothetical protein